MVDLFKTLFAYSLKLVSSREYSTSVVRSKLLSRSNDPKVVESVLTKLQELNYLSDDRFIDSFIRSQTNHGFGSNLISLKLRQKGIPLNVIKTKLASQDKSNEIDALKALYQKKFPTLTKYPEKERLLRFKNYAYGKGFPLDLIDAFLKHRVEYDC